MENMQIQEFAPMKSSLLESAFQSGFAAGSQYAHSNDPRPYDWDGEYDAMMIASYKYNREARQDDSILKNLIEIILFAADPQEAVKKIEHILYGVQ